MSEIIKVLVRGRVQGVGFRYFTQNLAHGLGIAGWVRNLPGGGVEALARVAPSNKQRFLAALQKGPPYSKVDEVRVETLPGNTNCPENSFNIRR